MRIGILSQWYDPEPGPAAVPGVVARGLQAAGHEVVVLTGFPNYPSGQLAAGYRQRPHLVEHLDGIEVHRVPLIPSHDRSAVGRVANYGSFAISAAIAALPVLGRVDAVWIYNSPITVGLPAAVLRLIGRVPGVLHVQDLWPDSVVASGLLPTGPAGRLAARGLAAVAAMTYRLAATVAVISPGMQDILERRGVPSSKISWLPNCADEQLFTVVPYDTALAEEIGAVGRFTVMYGGSLGDVQALDTAVRAASLLTDRPAFRLLFVGSGVAEAGLRALVDELGLDNVEFLGRRPASEMPALMRVCDAQLISLDDQPFLAATMPSKVQTVLATGRPAVVCARGDVASLVEDAAAGVTCLPGDPAALAESIRSLVDAPAEALDAMGDRGHAYYWKHLSAARLTERLVDVCADAAGVSRAAAVSAAREDRRFPSGVASSSLIRSENVHRVFSLGERPVAAIPAASRRQMFASASQYQAGTARRAVVRSALRGAVLARVDRIVSRSTVTPLGTEYQPALDSWLAAACAALSEPDLAVTYVWPPQQDRGRVYAHLATRSGRRLAFAKLSFNAENDASLLRERDMLAEVETMFCSRFSAPRTISTLPFADRQSLLTDLLPASARSIPLRQVRYPSAAVAQYRGNTRVLDREGVERATWWADRLVDLPARSAFAVDLAAAVDAGVEVCIAHGDLSPLNMAADRHGKLWLFDWEDGARDAPLWTDRVALALGTSPRGRRSQWLSTVLSERPSTAGELRGGRWQRAVLGLAFRYSRGIPDATPIVESWPMKEHQ